MADDDKDTKASPPPSSSSSSETSSKDGGNGNGNGSNTFYNIFESTQQNIEALNDSTKELEKINDRFLFRASTISSQEESVLMQQVSKILTQTNTKARDTKKLINKLRVEATKPAPAAGSESKSFDEKSEEEKDEESRDAE